MALGPRVWDIMTSILQIFLEVSSMLTHEGRQEPWVQTDYYTLADSRAH